MSVDAVLTAAFLQGTHSMKVLLIGGHQEFSALFEGQTVFPAKGNGQGGACFAE